MSVEEKSAYMNEILGKAETLIEALPYIRDFNNKIVLSLIHISEPTRPY